MSNTSLQSGSSRWFSGRSAGLRDLSIGGLLALIYLIMTMATTSMGFTRDESFYFNYSKVYWNWIVSVSQAESGPEREALLGKTEVQRVWKQNFEHPPLMKVLFGLSWRYLGAKNRPVSFLDEGQIRISELGVADGFDQGDQAVLMAPVPLGEDPSRREVLGTYVVSERQPSHAVAGPAAEGGPSAEALERCTVAAQSMRSDSEPTWLRGCEMQSDGALQFLSESDSFRFPGAFMGAMLVLALFLFGVEFGGRRLGALAVLFYSFMPHTFFHAHLTCFDVPIIAVSMWVLFAFYRSLKSNGWAVACGFLWGLGLLTKLNAFFLPITLVAWWVVSSYRAFRWDKGLHLPSFPKAFLWMIFLGFPMLFLLWPSLWYDSFQSLGKYMAFHLTHDHYYQYYFGTGYQAPPFPPEFSFVFTLMSTPLVPLVLALAGFFRVYLLDLGRWVVSLWMPGLRDALTQRWGSAGTGMADAGWGRAWFVLIHMGFPMLLIAMPGTPIFGGIKHWLQAYPFACLLAGQTLLTLFDMVAVWWSAGAANKAEEADAVQSAIEGETQPLTSPSQDEVRARGWQQRARGLVPAVGAVALVALIAAPGVRDTFKYVEYGTAYYNEIIGGLRGAAEQRMQRQFWSYANRGAIQEVNIYAPMRSAVDFQDATPGTCEMLQRDGLMRADLACSARGSTKEVMLFDVEERFSEEEIHYWERMDTIGPAWEVTVDGVPMVRAYKKGAGYDWAASQE